jgi:ferredoxin
MIAIQIDDQACVSCALCVDACPTEVFTFDEAKGIPVVAKPGECFGCLACSQECPADAIHHEGVLMSKNFHQNPEALGLASRIAGAPSAQVHATLDEQGLKSGLADLSVRLLSLGAVLKETLSTGLPAVGSLAGRTLAAQLPRYRVPKDMEQTLKLAQQRFAPAWEIEPSLEGDAFKVKVQSCFVRDVCAKEKCELGGEMCVLFGNYLVGYLQALTGMRLRLMQAGRDWKTCSYEAKVYH